MAQTHRATIFVDDPGNKCAPEVLVVQLWLQRWKETVSVIEYSSGGWEHLWTVEGPAEAIEELPPELLCHDAQDDPAAGT